MGAWGLKPWDKDAAADYFGRLYSECAGEPMTNKQRVMSLDSLEAYLNDLFGEEISPSAPNGYQLAFTAGGKLKEVMAALQAKTGDDGWTGEASSWFYNNEPLNVSICLSAAPRCVLVIASIASLHLEALKSHADRIAP